MLCEALQVNCFMFLQPPSVLLEFFIFKMHPECSAFTEHNFMRCCCRVGCSLETLYDAFATFSKQTHSLKRNLFVLDWLWTRSLDTIADNGTSHYAIRISKEWSKHHEQ